MTPSRASGSWLETSAAGLGLIGYGRMLASPRAAPVPLLLTILFAILVVGTGLSVPVDRALRSLRDMARSHPASGKVVLIEIDAKSIAGIDKWPWPRSVHARAVDRLREAGADPIAFDVDFSARSTFADDMTLRDALRRAGGGVILPTFSQSEDGTGTRSIDNLPIKRLREVAFLGAVTIVPDSDGLVRNAPLATRTGGVVRPALAALLAGGMPGVIGFYPIDFAVDPATIPRLSFTDLLAGHLAPGSLRGKRILIGATAVEMGDRYAVPGRGVIPGAVIQAVATENLLRGRIPGQAGPALALLLAFAAIAAVSWGQSHSIKLTTGAILVLLFGPAVTQGLWALDFQVAGGLLALGFGLAVVGARGAIGAYADRAFTQESTGLPNLASFTFENRWGSSHLVAVAYVANTSAMAATLGPELMARLQCAVAERLIWSAAGAPIHQIDDATFAWHVAAGDEGAMCDRFDALATMMRAPVRVGDTRVDVSVAFGLANDDSVRQAIANAAHAAVEASKSGSRWQRYSSPGADESAWRLGMLGELEEALESGDVFVVYQPKRNLESDRITCAEALVRWHHPTRGLIPPDDFIALAEAGGRIEQLTEFVLDRALADVATVGPGFGVAVNLSAALLGSLRIVPIVRAAIARHAIAPRLLTLEVTESAAIHRTSEAVATLAELRLLGARISIDDYGTGQSTLDYLKRLPASELKIDKSFVQAMLENRSDAILVASTINLARELGLEVVAEGVESLGCLDQLRQLRCTYAQGYLVGKPMRIADLRALCDREDVTRKAA